MKDFKHLNKFLIYLFGISLFFVILGSLIPNELFDNWLPEVDWITKSQGIFGLSMIIILSYLFSTIGNRYSKLKGWCENTILGVAILLLGFGSLWMMSIILFSIIPLHGFILIILSAFSALYSIFLFFEYFSIKQ